MTHPAAPHIDAVFGTARILWTSPNGKHELSVAAWKAYYADGSIQLFDTYTLDNFLNYRSQRVNFYAGEAMTFDFVPPKYVIRAIRRVLAGVSGHPIEIRGALI